MLKVSALLSLIIQHHRFFSESNQPMPPDTVATVERLLSCCQEEAADMEARLFPVEEPPVKTNVIHVDFAAAVPPATPDIA